MCFPDNILVFFMSLLNVSELFVSEVPRPNKDLPSRRRSNSQSQGVQQPPFISTKSTHGAKTPHNQGSASSTARNGQYASPRESRPPLRPQSEYYVTLVPLNDTFIKKHIHVPFFPDTVRLGRPTGTKIKPHVSNGYFDSRVLLRNHACMFVDAKTGLLMLQDMGLSNGTFVNLEKLQVDPVVVTVGDTINLGFNIQLETSHKQISARIDNITVVSNNPTGPVLDGLPALTNDAIAGFSPAEMRHLDFIQSMFATPDESDESNHPTAFDLAMFADVAPLDAALDAPAEAPAGVFAHSRIAASVDVEGALDALAVNVARVTQQNAALRLLEQFVANYASQVDDMTKRSVAAEVARCQARFDEVLAAEKSKSSEAAAMAELRSAEYRGKVQNLENEVERLRGDLENINNSVSVRIAPESTTPDSLQDREMEEEETERGEKNEEAGQSEQSEQSDHSEKSDIIHQTTDANDLHGSFDFAPRSLKELSPGSIHHSESETEKNVAPHGAKEPYLRHLTQQAAHYKNQGVFFGFCVVVAGFLYQSSAR